MQQIQLSDLKPAGPNTWIVRKYLRRDKSTGRAIRPCKTFNYEKREDALPAAQAWWTRQMQAAGLGSGTRLADMVRNRIDMLERLGRLDASSAKAYRSKLRLYIEPIIGHMDIADVKQADLNDLYAGLLDHGGRCKEGISPNTVRIVHAILHGCYKDWVDDGICTSNPAASAKQPRKTVPETRAFDSVELDVVITEINQLLSDESVSQENIARRQVALAAFLALHLGLREGEVCALRERDVDILSSRTVRVCGTVKEVKGPPVRSEHPKRNSKRNVACSEAVCRVVVNHLVWRRKWVHVHGAPGDMPLLCTRTGDWIRPSSISKAFKKMCDCLGIENASFHTLRHTHATVLIGQGSDIKTVAERMGHARTSTTTDIYAHAIPGRDSDAAEAFSKALEGIGE